MFYGLLNFCGGPRQLGVRFPVSENFFVFLLSMARRTRRLSAQGSIPRRIRVRFSLFRCSIVRRTRRVRGRDFFCTFGFTTKEKRIRTVRTIYTQPHSIKTPREVDNSYLIVDSATTWCKCYDNPSTSSPMAVP